MLAEAGGDQVTRTAKAVERSGATSHGSAEACLPLQANAYECARKLDIETPIIDQVYAVLYEGKPPAQGLQELLGRDQKDERL